MTEYMTNYIHNNGGSGPMRNVGMIEILNEPIGVGKTLSIQIKGVHSLTQALRNPGRERPYRFNAREVLSSSFLGSSTPSPSLHNTFCSVLVI